MPDPRWVRWPVVLLATADAGWMIFDGGRALIVGDYVTAAGGQLGPWASLVSAIGVEPRGTGMKLFFAGYGTLWLVGVAGYAARRPWGRTAVTLGAAGSLWYLVAGTASSVLQLALLAAGARRR